MIETFNRTGPLMEAASYPDWAQRLIQDCSASKRRVIEHELYQRMRDNRLSAKTMRQYLIGAGRGRTVRVIHGPEPDQDPFCPPPGRGHGASLVDAQYPCRTQPCRLLGELSRAHGVSLEDLQAQQVAPSYTP